MAKKKASQSAAGTKAPHCKRNAHAAGIDVGAEIHYVAVESGPGSSTRPLFWSLDQDLHVLADWLCKCGGSRPWRWSPRAFTGFLVPNYGSHGDGGCAW